MNLFKLSFAVCKQNLRKWTSDYRVLIVFILLFIVSHYHASWFLKFSQNIGGNTGVAPWIYVFAFTGYAFVKIMMFSPLLLLFSTAPFIDDNQPFMIARCTRKSWCLGQIFYIVISSAIYVITSVLFSVLMLVDNIEITSDWGTVLTTAVKAGYTEGASSLGVSAKILYYFSPYDAMFYTMLLVWFSCIVLGLLIYVVNSLTGKTGYGIFAGAFLLFFDLLQTMIRSAGDRFAWLSYISPISWCSIDIIDLTKRHLTPDIRYVMCGYAVLIVVLSAVALIISKKQEISVIQSV